ncbi:helix-turn-helix transcriptional regulator [Patulibacter minatonensis]|uniref:helix-turn-helix transcriptional regulator n=1 Tax=Patulibacter minatonensis TaxID=298163 RepID=UPI0004B34FD5|nr:LuxR family transcriptional regulator [Patulibacter minatonensis]
MDAEGHAAATGDRHGTVAGELDALRGVLDDVERTLAVAPTDDATGYASLAPSLDDVDARARRTLLAASDRPPADVAVAAAALSRSTRLRGVLTRRETDARLAALRRVHDALGRLEDAGSVDELLPRAAAELATACGFDRTVISRRRGATWRAEAVWFSPDLDAETSAATERYLRETWIPIGPKALEADLVRRRAPDLVMAGDPRTTPELMSVSGSPGYVAAPVMPTGTVIGFLQADRLDRTVTALDRDVLWTFAEGFGFVFERVALGERLDTQLARVRTAFRTAEQGLMALSAAERDVFRRARPPADNPPDLAGAPLTGREREILDLMVTGATNAEIAERLVVGETTVKSHVHVVLRKLGAASRADAVARHLRTPRTPPAPR